MSCYETELLGATCRLCACSEEEPCWAGCSWVFDPAFGPLCSSCLRRVFEALKRHMEGVSDEADVALLHEFTGTSPDRGPVAPLAVPISFSPPRAVAA